MISKICSSLILIVFIFGCNNPDKNKGNQEKVSDSLAALGYFGEISGIDSVMQLDQFLFMMKTSDSLRASVEGLISNNCEHSGCWMEIDLENGQTMRVTFKDEKFTIPLNSKGKRATVKGMAYRKLIPVEELKKIALDEGLSQENVDTINFAKSEIHFVAQGLIIKEQ